MRRPALDVQPRGRAALPDARKRVRHHASGRTPLHRYFLDNCLCSGRLLLLLVVALPPTTRPGGFPDALQFCASALTHPFAVACVCAPRRRADDGGPRAGVLHAPGGRRRVCRPGQDRCVAVSSCSCSLLLPWSSACYLFDCMLEAVVHASDTLARAESLRVVVAHH